MKKLLPAARAAAAGALLVAGAASAIDLDESYARALAVDPTTLAADQAVVAGREKAVQGRALLKPQVSLTAGVNYVDQRTSTDLPAALSQLIKPESSGTVHQAAVQLAQPIYNAKAVADKRQLEQQAGLAEIRHRDARQDLIVRVGEAYFNVLFAEEALRVTRAEKAAVALQRDRAQARFELGRGKVTEVQETQARYDTVVTKEISAESTLALRQAQFRELTGTAADGLAGLRDGFVPTPPEPDDLLAWQARGKERNPRVQASRGSLAIASAEIAKHTLSGRPTLDLVASYAYQGQNGSLSATVSPDRSRTAVIGVQLNIPLFAGGAIQSRQRESVAKKSQAEHDVGAAERDARLQVQDAFLSVKTGVARVGSLTQSARSAQTALEATTLGRDVGTRTDLDVLDAQQRLFNAQLDLAQARNDYLLGRLRLAAAAGDLEAGELHAINGYLRR